MQHITQKATIHHKLNEKTFQHNHITIARADKSKAIVLIKQNNHREKVYEFLQENNIMKINKDPTDK